MRHTLFRLYLLCSLGFTGLFCMSSCGDDPKPTTSQQTTPSTTADTTPSTTPRVECVNDIDCDEVGVLCLENRCRAAYCRPGVQFCEDGVPHVCDPSAQSSTAQDPCTSEERCNQGLCIPLLCTPNEVRCERTSRLRCNELGTGFITRPCQGNTVCFNADCVDPVCEPSTLSCLNDLQLGRCVESGGGYESLPCAFAQRCTILPTNNPNEPNDPSCAPFHALNLVSQSSLSSNAKRPDSGSISFWLTLELPENPEERPSQLELMRWTHPNRQGLEATFDTLTSTLTFKPAASENPDDFVEVVLDISPNITSHIAFGWTPSTLSLHVNGLPLVVDHPLSSPLLLGTPSDTLRIGQFSDAKVSWIGRLSSILVSSTTPSSEIFTPTCDNTHSEQTLHWALDEGEGNTARASSDTPGNSATLSILSASWTGGVMPRFTRDADGDFFGFNEDATFACSPPAEDYVLPALDCNDGNPSVYPGAPELQDQIDNDCDEETDEVD